MFISSLRFSGLVSPCIRTDTASDYRTTFFKGPEVNVPVSYIIKVITHRGHRRLSPERGPGQTAGLCSPAQQAACPVPGPILDSGSLGGAAMDCIGAQGRPQACVWVRLRIRSCIDSRDRWRRNPHIRPEKSMTAAFGFRKYVMIALCLVFICIPFLWLRWVKSLSAFLLYTHSHPFICLSSPPKAPFHICIYMQVCLRTYTRTHTHTHTLRAPESLLNSALHLRGVSGEEQSHIQHSAL